MDSFIDRKLLQQHYLYIPNLVNHINALKAIIVVDETVSNNFLLRLGVSEDNISTAQSITNKTRFVFGNSHVFQELQLEYDQVHYTKYVSEGSSLCWIRSKRGSDLSIFRRICLVDFRLQELEPIITLNNPVNVICGDRGSGKTFYLRWIMQKIQEKESDVFIKFIQAMDIRRFLKQCMNGDQSCDKFLLLEFLGVPIEHTNIVLLVDGIDDMYLFETEAILKILEDIHLNNSDIRFWVTCHSNNSRDSLEKTCGTFVTYLSPFTEAQRRDYLQKELANGDQLQTDTDSFIHGSLAIGGSWKWPSYFHTVDSNDCPNEESFTSLPLHLNFISKLDDVPQDLLCVYNDCISHQLEEFDSGDKDILESCLTQLAMLSLFENAEEKFPMLRNVLPMLEERIVSDWNDKMVNVVDKVVQFEHMNVRDFLAAKWMSNNYSIYRDRFADCLICGMCSDVFAMFFNRHLAEDCRLHLLVIDQNLDRALEYLTLDSNVIYCKDRGGRSPLHLAAISGAEEIAGVLLDSGADVNTRDDVLLWTPLQYADLNSGNCGTAEIILKHGGNTNHLQFTNSASALEIGRRLDKAIQHSCINLIRHICSNCKRLRITSKHVYEAIDCLDEESCLETVLKVAETNPTLADNEYADGCGYTALFLATEKGYLKAVQYLIETLVYNINVKASFGESLLHVACANGHESIASYLIEKGVDINAVNQSNVTPFGESCGNGHLQIARMLKQAGADITIRQQEQSTLKIAAMGGHLEVVNFLLEELGPERDILNSIFFMDNFEIIRTLIRSGADVNCSDESGNTPLHQVYGASLEVIKLLLNHSADCNALNIKDEPPLFSMCQADDAEMKIKELLDYGADLFYQKPNGENIMHAAGSEVIPFLISAGIDVNSRTSTGETPLHTACADGDSDVVAALLEHGAEAMARANNGVTPLHYACNNRRCIELLVDAGADVNACTIDDGQTPIFYALKNADSTDTIELLVSLGADITARDLSRRTPLHHACRLGFLECVRFLTKDVDATDIINASDILGNTPLHYALSEKNSEESLFQRREDVIVYLIEELKVKTDIPNDDGKTAKDIILENDNMRKYIKDRLAAYFHG